MIMVDKEKFNEFVDEVEKERFMVTKFKEMGKEDDHLFQSLVFLQKARGQITTSRMVAACDESLPADIGEGFVKIQESLQELEDLIRKTKGKKEDKTIEDIHFVDVVATAGIGPRSYFELHFLDAEKKWYQTKIVNCQGLKDLGVMKRVSAGKAEKWLNTEEGKRWAFDEPNCSIR